MKEFSIEILGSSWEVLIRKESEEGRLKACSGFTDWTSRKIVIADGWSEGNLEYPEVYMLKVLRHEIVHAFMFESGLGDDWEHLTFGQEETVVDWIAYQFSKMHTAISEAERKLKEALNGEI